jgi:hypothetical protein
MQPSIEVRGLRELHDRFKAFPRKYSAAVTKTLQASLLILQGSAPKYPAKPAGSTYRRTGTLGRSLGTSMSGSKMGKPDIFKITKGGGFQEGRYGTRLGYAPHVVGDSATQQARRMKHWWTVPQTVLAKALPKINAAFEKLAVALASYLDRNKNP